MTTHFEDHTTTQAVVMVPATEINDNSQHVILSMNLKSREPSAALDLLRPLALMNCVQLHYKWAQLDLLDISQISTNKYSVQGTLQKDGEKWV